MVGGLAQLVAYGAQDVYLTGNPPITFFNIRYSQHTNFSVELITQIILIKFTIRVPKFKYHEYLTLEFDHTFN